MLPFSSPIGFFCINTSFCIEKILNFFECDELTNQEFTYRIQTLQKAVGAMQVCMELVYSTNKGRHLMVMETEKIKITARTL